MSLSFLVPNRTVLLVSDDALYIYATSSKGVKPIETVPWGAKDFVENVSSIIVKECGRKPVMILNDMVEQHYRKERIVKSGVNSLDRATMLKRRLSVAFSSYPVRAALPLKEKIAKTAKQPAADIYIFAAIPDTEQLDLSTRSVQKSLVSISGLGLLPVESADMVKSLSTKLSKKTKKKAMWSVFIGQHQSGNLRQIVTKNGELALTRMTPLPVEYENTANWSQEVYKELKGTMGYLSRFGYDPSDGLDVIMVADQSVSETFESLVEEDFNLHMMSVHQAASTLGINIGHQHSAHYADILHVAWVGQKNSMTLPMKAASVDRVDKPRKVAMVASFLMFCGAAFLGYYAVGQVTQLSTVNEDITSAKKRKAQLDLNYKQEVQRKEEMGFDVELVQNSILLHDELESNNIDALFLFKNIGMAMGRDLRIDDIDVRRYRADPGKRLARFGQNNANQKDPIYEARIKMTYPGTTNVDQGNEEVSTLRDRLAAILKEHDVEVSKFLRDYEYTEGLVVETGDLETENLQQDFVAEIRITGPAPQEGDSQ